MKKDRDLQCTTSTAAGFKFTVRVATLRCDLIIGLPVLLGVLFNMYADKLASLAPWPASVSFPWSTAAAAATVGDVTDLTDAP